MIAVEVFVKCFLREKSALFLVVMMLAVVLRKILISVLFLFRLLNIFQEVYFLRAIIVQNNENTNLKYDY